MTHVPGQECYQSPRLLARCISSQVLGAGHSSSPVVETGRLPARNVHGVRFEESEATAAKKSWNVAVEVTAAAELLPDGTDSALPFTNAFVGSESVFAEEKAAIAAKDPCDLSQSLRNIGNRAEGVGDNNSVDTLIRKGDLFSGRAKEFNRKGCTLRLLSGERPHLHRGIQRPEMSNQTAVVEGQVQPRPETDLENSAGRRRNYLRTLPHVGIAAARKVHHARKNEAIVEVHENDAADA